MSSPIVGRTPLVAPTLRAAVEPSRVARELAGAVGIAAVALRRAPRAGRRRRRGCSRPGRRAAPAGPGPRPSPARRTRGARPASRMRGRALGVGARRPDPHGDRHLATRSIARTTLVDVGVDRARRLHLEDRAASSRVSFASRDRVEHRATRWAGRGSPRPARRRCRAGRRGGVAAPRRHASSASSDARATTSDEQRDARVAAGARSGTPVASVDHGPRALLLGLPGRDRRGQGRGREDDGDRRARHRSGPHGHERADRRGRGQIGARRVLRRSRRSPTRKPELRPGLRARTLTPDDALLEYLDDHGLRRISPAAQSTRARSTWSRPRSRG